MEGTVRKDIAADAEKRRLLVDDRRRLGVLRDIGMLDADYPTAHFDALMQTMSLVFEDLMITINIMGIDTVQSVAANTERVPSEIPREYSLFEPVASDSGNYVVLDAWADPRFSQDHPTVHSEPFLRFFCFSPIYYENVVIGSIVLTDKSPKASFPLCKVELLAAFGRTVTEIISCDAKRRQQAEARYMQVLHSWPLSLSEGFRDVVLSFRNLDGVVFKIMSTLLSNGDSRRVQQEDALLQLSGALSGMNVRLDIVRFIGQMMLEFKEFRESTKAPSVVSGGMKDIQFAALMERLAEAVGDYGCEDAFVLTVDQTAESLSTITTFPSSIVTMLRCLFAFFGQSNILLSALCAVVIDQLDFRDCIKSGTTSLSGKLCFEFVATGTYTVAPEFSALWGCDPPRSSPDCSACMDEQFAWLRDILSRMGAGMSVPRNTTYEEGECMSVSMWFPCMFHKSELVLSKEILLATPSYQSNAVSSPLVEDTNFSIAPSEVIRGDRSLSHAVLVIDDSVLVQKMFKKMFKTLGVECEVASNGATGLELMKTRHFDIVFVDFIMPEQGGVSTIQMFSEWRMNKLYSGMFIMDTQDIGDGSSFDDPLLIVGMSGTYDSPAVREGFRSGIRVFLMKPVSIDKCRQICDAKIGGLLNTEYAGKQLSDLSREDVEALAGQLQKGESSPRAYR